MTIQDNILLAPLTTFKIGGVAKYYVKVNTQEDLLSALSFAQEKDIPVLVLGSGSNMLVSDRGFQGLVIESAFKGIGIKETDTGAEVKAAAGENWDDVVAFAALNNFWGIENLSGIPGTVGAFPVQNVGAYGQEASQVIKEVEVWDIEEKRTRVITNEECGFDYRHSNFNSEWQGKFVILNVVMELSKQAKPNLTYRDVEKYFLEKKISTPTITDIRFAILEIRKGKFPDLNEFGCAGSFFKNFILTPQEYLTLEEKLTKEFSPEVVTKLKEIKERFNQIKSIKIPSAFLIDICNLKGKTLGGAKLWEKQPLVIVNTGSAKAIEVAGLFSLVQKEVLSRTGLKLMPEPEFIGFEEIEIAKYLNL